jgi:hypothetical protein
MMKNTLYNGHVCSAHVAFFWGSIFPYAASFLLYKGTLLISLLSWAGLVVNGSVAFLLPVTLVILSHHNLRKYGPQPKQAKEVAIVPLTKKSLDVLNRSNHEKKSMSLSFAFIIMLILDTTVSSYFSVGAICFTWQAA